jgi:hypothetical protein
MWKIGPGWNNLGWNDSPMALTGKELAEVLQYCYYCSYTIVSFSYK